MFSPICFTNFSQLLLSLSSWKRKEKLFIGPKQGFLSLPFEKEIIINIRQENLKIRNSRLVKLSDELVVKVQLFSSIAFLVNTFSYFPFMKYLEKNKFNILWKLIDWSEILFCEKIVLFKDHSLHILFHFITL